MTDRPHVISVGFSQAHRASYDFDRYRISVLLHEKAVPGLPSDLLSQFADLAIIDASGPSSADLAGYDRAADQILASCEDLVARHGVPAGVLGLFENSVIPAAMIRDRWRVPGVNAATARRFRDKITMKEALRGTGIRLPRFWKVGPETPSELIDDIVATLPGKVVMKPIDQAASVGVQIFADGAEFARYVRAEGLAEDVDVEEFIEGQICMFDGVVRDGVIRFFSASKYLNSVFDYRTASAPVAVVTLDDPDVIERSMSFTHRVLSALGLRDSSFHLEAFVTDDDEFVFLEVACRFGGAGISAQLKSVYGVDIVDESIRACLGEPSQLTGPPTMLDKAGVGASGFIWLALAEQRPCVVKRIRGLDTCPDSVLSSEIPNIGQMLNGSLGVWPSSGKFMLAGPSTSAVEADMITIADSYRLDLAIT